MFNTSCSPQHKHKTIITTLNIAHSFHWTNAICNTTPILLDIFIPSWDEFKNNVAESLPHIHVQPFPLPHNVELATCKLLLQWPKISFRKSTLELGSRSPLMFWADRYDNDDHYHRHHGLSTILEPLASNMAAGGDKIDHGYYKL
jgi:hypothetical protein